MCSPQAGRVFNGIATAGLSEAIRPAFRGSNLDAFDNSGYFGPLASFGLQKFQQSQNGQNQQTDTSSLYQQPFQNPYSSVGQSQTKNQTIK